MKYRTYKDMRATMDSYLFPRYIAAIAAIPRSGIIPAAYLSIRHNIPMPQFGSDFSMNSGPKLARDGKLLVVDDSISTGGTLKAFLDSNELSDKDIMPLAIYAADKSTGIDYLEYLPQPRLFEWNFQRHGIMTESAWDMDGVICQDWTLREVDHPLAYESFLHNAVPQWLPHVKIKAIVSGRYERRRPETVDWLSRHGVQYDELVLWPYPNRSNEAVAKWKLDCAKQLSASLFVESNPKQAAIISRSLPCLCPPTGELFLDGNTDN